MQTGLFEQISQYHTTLKTQNRRWHSPPPIIWGLPSSQKHEQPELGPCLVHSYNSELHVALHEQPPLECPGTGLGKALPQNTSHTGPGGRMVVQPAVKQNRFKTCKQRLFRVWEMWSSSREKPVKGRQFRCWIFGRDNLPL